MKGPDNVALESTNEPGCACTGEGCTASVDRTGTFGQDLPAGKWAFWVRLLDSCGGSLAVSHELRVYVNGKLRPECGTSYLGNNMCTSIPCNGPTARCELPQ